MLPSRSLAFREILNGTFRFIDTVHHRRELTPTQASAVNPTVNLAQRPAKLVTASLALIRVPFL
jgi:hypothetical protein